MPIDPSKVKAARLARELSQANAARIAGIKPAQWAHYEQGVRSNPTVTQAQRIAAACGVKLDDILSSVPS